MPLPTAAFLVAALALQPGQSPAPGAAPAPLDYVILADQAGRARVGRLIERRPAGARPLRESTEGGMWFVGCITAWRDNPGQRDDCLDSRLRRQGPAGTIVLNTYHPKPAGVALAVACHGPGGIGRAEFRASPGPRDGAALEACLGRAMAASAAPARRWVGVRWAHRFAIEDPAEARRRAERVLVVAIDHVGVPRGSTGTCLIQGRVLREERGTGVAAGSLIEAGIPCTAERWPRDGRRASMGSMGEGGFGRLYLTATRDLADFETAEE
ncbi:MAG TPA: hypothetical protein VF759_05955 [Allosphingosinicella sp.]|jgi:hypothetical protein